MPPIRGGGAHSGKQSWVRSEPETYSMAIHMYCLQAAGATYGLPWNKLLLGPSGHTSLSHSTALCDDSPHHHDVLPTLLSVTVSTSIELFKH